MSTSTLFRSAALLLLLAAGTPGFAQTTVTLQEGLNGYTGSTDTWMWSGAADTNYGSRTDWEMRLNTTTATLLRFPIFQAEGGPVPDGATITSATLSVYKFNGATSGTYNARRLLKAWVESQATWNSASSGTPWETGGAQGASDATTAGEAQASMGPELGWLNYNVLAIVQAWAGGAANHGFRMRQVAGENQPHNFIAKDHATQSTLRPKLTLTYTTPPAGTSATLQEGLNGYTGSTDTWMWSGAADTNYGSRTDWEMRLNTTTATLLRFPIFQAEGGPVPNGVTITGATLSVYKFNGATDGTYNARRLLRPWVESQATWNSASSGSAWETGGAQGASDATTAGEAQASIGPELGWLNYDVLAIVQAWADGAPNHGFRMRQIAGENQPHNFIAKDHATQSTLRPKLTIHYSDPGLPTAQVTTDPDPATGEGPLTVVFNAVSSIDNGSPISELNLRFGHGTPENQVTWFDKNETKSYVYPAGAASYTATLTVKNAAGWSAAKTVNVNVTPGALPTASLSADPVSGNGPLNVTFDASGSSSDVTNLRLDFGHAGQFVEWQDRFETKQYTYPAGQAQYTASLTVWNNNGPSNPPATSTISVDQPGCSGDNPPSGTQDAAPLGRGAALPTFHSMSLYYNPVGAPASESVFMRYRRACESVWREGWPLWFDPRTSGFDLPYAFRARGSAVYLQPNTKYYFQFGTGTSHSNAAWEDYHLQATTWNLRPDNIPDDPTPRSIPTGTNQAVWSPPVGGSASGYAVYNGGGGTRTMQSTANNCIVVNQSYVVIRNVVCNGARQSGILIADGVHHVVIEDVEVTDFTQQVQGHSYGDHGLNDTAGVRLGTHAGADGCNVTNNEKIVVQRAKLHTPRLGALPRDSGGAQGPYGIFVENGGRQNVFRYNEIYSTGTKDQWFQDGIGGSRNFSAVGSPGADSDIYHNILRNMMDDGVEAEGGGRNVRVWGNYIDHVGPGAIATQVAHYGPIYIFRNVINRQRNYHDLIGPGDSEPLPDADQLDNNRGKGFKQDGNATDCSTTVGGGRRYIFNNTLLQQPGNTYQENGVPKPQDFDLGAGEGIAGSNITQTWSRNNILHVWRSGSSSVRISGGSSNSIDYDLYNGVISSGTEANGLAGAPRYKSGHGWNAGPRLWFESQPGAGLFQLEDVNSPSPGIQRGAHLPNFTRDIDNVDLARKSGVEIVTGQCGGGVLTGCPDIGAHQRGPGSMKFGVTAESP